MKILGHFPLHGPCNTYIMGPDAGGQAILIDPGKFDLELLNLIEDNSFDVSTIFITDSDHAKGLDTFLSTYTAHIIAGSDYILRHSASKVQRGSVGAIGDIRYKVLDVRGGSDSSRIYKIGSYLFTGDTIFPGHVISDPDSSSRELLLKSLKQNFSKLPDHTIILPSHGPPSNVIAEKQWNQDLKTMPDI